MESINSTLQHGKLYYPRMFRIIPHRALIEPKATILAIEAEGAGSTATLRIDGLLCSACATNVRDSLERLDGVSGAQVDLVRGEARVEYDQARATPAALIDAIEGAVVLWPLRRLLARLTGHRRSA
jgi:copper chaperone CopZ